MQFLPFCGSEPLLVLKMSGEAVRHWVQGQAWKGRGMRPKKRWNPEEWWQVGREVPKVRLLPCSFSSEGSPGPHPLPQPGTSEKLGYSACHSWHSVPQVCRERGLGVKPGSAWWHWLWSGSGNFQSLNLRFLVRFNGKDKHQQWLFLLVDPDRSSDPIAWLGCRPHSDPPIPTSPETLKSDLGSNPSSVAYSL